MPARVRLLSVMSHRLGWGRTVRITGQLEGGYLPARGALVRLRVVIDRVVATFSDVEELSPDDWGEAGD